MSKLVGEYFDILADPDRSLKEIRGPVVATGSPELIRALALVECSTDNMQEAFVEVIHAMREQLSLPKVDEKYIGILVKIQRRKGKRPNQCDSVFRNSS